MVKKVSHTTLATDINH